MKKQKTYRAPEVVELGKASRLTLGGSGCGIDSYLCEHEKTELEG
jgi:hypothetical protein